MTRGKHCSTVGRACVLQFEGPPHSRQDRESYFQAIMTYLYHQSDFIKNQLPLIVEGSLFSSNFSRCFEFVQTFLEETTQQPRLPFSPPPHFPCTCSGFFGPCEWKVPCPFLYKVWQMERGFAKPNRTALSWDPKSRFGWLIIIFWFTFQVRLAAGVWIVS